jgi:hypothetical protein
VNVIVEIWSSMRLAMIFRMLVFLIGFGLAVAGGITVVLYLNLLATGYSITEYFLFISKKMESYLLPVGIALIWSSIYLPYRRKDDFFE